MAVKKNMSKKRIISPSLLSADFSQLAEQIGTVEKAGADRLHLDIMDGQFVPNITFGPFIVKAIRKSAKSHLECHLMISEPRRYFDNFIDAGADTVIFHVEASDDILGDLQYLRGKGVKAGLSLKPDKSAKVLEPYLNDVDYILVMSVYPGFGGQEFIGDTLQTMKDLVRIRPTSDLLIAVDGGVNMKTISKVYETGIDITIVGSGLFGADNIQNRYEELLRA